MNFIELNAILYYADFMSMKITNHPVTDNCKYYFIHNCPINSAYLVDSQPMFDVENAIFKQSKKEYELLADKFGEEGAMTFLEDISNLKAAGTVDAKSMLKCIHLFSTKHERKMAYNSYYNWLDNLKYTHLEKDEEGNDVEVECSRYIAHAEIDSTRRKVYRSDEVDNTKSEGNT